MAKSLAAFGCNVALVDLNKDTANQAAQEIEACYSIKAIPIQADVSNE